MGVHRLNLWLVLVLAILAGACAARYSVNPTTFQGPPVASPRSAITVGPLDVFEVRVYGEKDLSGVYQVSGRGMIRFPLIGLVKVEGLTPTEIEELLRRKLVAGYLRDPQVTVVVTQFNSKKIFIFGEVQRPGTFPYEANMTIVQAITLAGGFTKTAWKNRTNVTRIVDGQERKIQVPVEAIGEGKERNFALRPGDIVFVPESPL
jgi:polysaccharide export outer membrane protein